MKDKIKKIIYIICPYICGALYGVFFMIAVWNYFEWAVRWNTSTAVGPYSPGANLGAYISSTAFHLGIVLLFLAAIVVNLLFNIWLFKKAPRTKVRLTVILALEVLIAFVVSLSTIVIVL